MLKGIRDLFQKKFLLTKGSSADKNEQDIRAFEDFFEEDSAIEVDCYGPPFKPPWIEFPNYQQYSMGFRMGPGEDYDHQFQNWYNGTTNAEIVAFKKKYPEPDHYPGYYDRLDKWKRDRDRA